MNAHELMLISTAFLLLKLILVVSWIGIGFISAFIIEKHDKETNPKYRTISIFVRFCWVIFWPIILIGYILGGAEFLDESI